MARFGDAATQFHLADAGPVEQIVNGGVLPFMERISHGLQLPGDNFRAAALHGGGVMAAISAGMIVGGVLSRAYLRHNGIDLSTVEGKERLKSSDPSVRWINTIAMALPAVVGAGCAVIASNYFFANRKDQLEKPASVLHDIEVVQFRYGETCVPGTAAAASLSSVSGIRALGFTGFIMAAAFELRQGVTTTIEWLGLNKLLNGIEHIFGKAPAQLMKETVDVLMAETTSAIERDGAVNWAAIQERTEAIMQTAFNRRTPAEMGKLLDDFQQGFEAIKTATVEKPGIMKDVLRAWANMRYTTRKFDDLVFKSPDATRYQEQVIEGVQAMVAAIAEKKAVNPTMMVVDAGFGIARQDVQLDPGGIIGATAKFFAFFMPALRHDIEDIARKYKGDSYHVPGIEDIPQYALNLARQFLGHQQREALGMSPA